MGTGYGGFGTELILRCVSACFDFLVLFAFYSDLFRTFASNLKHITLKSNYYETYIIPFGSWYG